MGKQNDWNDIDDVLYDGTKEEIENIVCPDCGSKIQYRYSGEVQSFEVKCAHCGHISRATGSPKPNCVEFFGDEYSFSE